jgi:hypothetical protein
LAYAESENASVSISMKMRPSDRHGFLNPEASLQFAARGRPPAIFPNLEKRTQSKGGADIDGCRDPSNAAPPLDALLSSLNGCSVMS